MNSWNFTKFNFDRGGCVDGEEWNQVVRYAIGKALNAAVCTGCDLM
jgi:hypothetical protein